MLLERFLLHVLLLDLSDMRCLSPILVRLPNHLGDYKFSPYERVPCGRCFNCLVNKRSQWAFRLNIEREYSSSSHFITLTYDNDHLPFHVENGKIYHVLNKDFMKIWLKRIVQYCRKYYHCNIKYYLCGEYGWEHGRPHYHMHLFNFPLDVDLFDFLSSRWPYGSFFIGSTNIGSSMYTTKHNLTKILSSIINPNYEVEQVSPPFMLCSKGIGRAFFEKLVSKSSNNSIVYNNIPYVPLDGNRIPTPRYYKFKHSNSRFSFTLTQVKKLKDLYKYVDPLPINKLAGSYFVNLAENYESLNDLRACVHRMYFSMYDDLFDVYNYTQEKLFELFKHNTKI